MYWEPPSATKYALKAFPQPLNMYWAFPQPLNMYWGLPPATEYVLGAVAGRGKKTENQAGEISHSFPFQKQPIGNIFWPSRVGPLPELLPLHISSSGAPPLAYFLLGGHSLLEKRKKFKLQFMNGRLRGKSLGKGVASQGRILQGGALRIH